MGLRKTTTLSMLVCDIRRPLRWLKKACTPNLPLGPAINDISTDLQDAPSFPLDKLELGPLPAKNVAIISKHYPKVQTLELPGVTPAVAFESALEVALTMPRWRMRLDDADAGLLQGMAVTRVFRFRDDFVVRIRPAGVGGRSSLVDMRSKSRLGVGDLGANATRIELYLGALAQALLGSGLAAPGLYEPGQLGGRGTLLFAAAPRGQKAIAV